MILVICLAGVVLVILAMLVYFAVRACKFNFVVACRAHRQIVLLAIGRRKNGKELLELLFTGAGLKHEVTDILGGARFRSLPN